MKIKQFSTPVLVKEALLLSLMPMFSVPGSQVKSCANPLWILFYAFHRFAFYRTCEPNQKVWNEVRLACHANTVHSQTFSFGRKSAAKI